MRKIILYPILILITFTGCFLDPGSSEPPAVVSTIYPKMDSSISTAVPAYLLLTNYDNRNRYIPKVTVNGSDRSIENFSLSDPRTKNLTNNDYYFPLNRKDIHFTVDLESLNNTVKSRSRATIEDQYSAKSVGNKHQFFIVNKDFNLSQTYFELVLKESLTGGPLLYVWVDEAQMSSIPAGSIEHLNSTFYNIFQKMTEVFGTHWGSNEIPNTLSENNKSIHILLTDIQNDQNISSNGYITGYFSPNDTLDETNSNKCLNLVIDSVDYFALYPGQTWSAQNLNVLYGISTIIHEFQHMIHWYQKSITNNINGDTFVNEMFSMIAEDLLAKDFLGYQQGGVTKYLTPDIQRVPLFNQFWDDNSSFHWNNNGGVGSLNNYSMSYVMGAYIIRNYGTSVISNYFEAVSTNSYGIQSPIVGKDGLLYALKKVDSEAHTTESLLKNFGRAVISSSSNGQNKPYSFRPVNSSLDSFNLKQINFFDNYVYPITAEMNNRLYDFDINSLELAYISGNYKYYNVPFKPLSLSQLNNIHRTRNFLSESNIYVYLGNIGKDDEIKVELYDSTISAKVIAIQ